MKKVLNALTGMVLASIMMFTACTGCCQAATVNENYKVEMNRDEYKRGERVLNITNCSDLSFSKLTLQWADTNKTIVFEGDTFDTNETFVQNDIVPSEENSMLDVTLEDVEGNEYKLESINLLAYRKKINVGVKLVNGQVILGNSVYRS